LRAFRSFAKIMKQQIVAPDSSQAPIAVPLRFDRVELSGAFADLGVFVPIAVALIVTNGLSATAVLLPAGLLYIASGLFYRLPVPVQPLKAFGAIAIAQGFGADEIAAGALLMGAIFLVLGGSGLLDRAAKLFPHPIIRGIQLSVGLLFCQLAWKLTTAPPTSFADHSQPTWWLVGAACAVAAAGFLLRRHAVALALVIVATLVMIVAFQGPLLLGPSEIELPQLDADVFAAAAVALVLPQLPLTFANSCLAAADAASVYFGRNAFHIRAGRLAASLGLANLLAGTICGMPVCHGAGGMTAHYSFGARTGGAPIAMGLVLVLLAFALGASLPALLRGFPLPILAGLLAIAGLLHAALLKDLRVPWHWALAVAIGVTGLIANLAIALAVGLLVWWTAEAITAFRGRGRLPKRPFTA
jgi:SulP family sulfate permease